MRVNDEEFLRYYWQELLYLRRLGESFARTYPKVAGRLELEAGVCPDPHVERLIESFAFLTARIQQNLDNEFPEIASELLGVLYPHLVTPVPSLTIARFEVDPDRGKLTTGFTVPRHTPLFAHSEGGLVCRFRTCYDVELWPVEVTEAAFESPDRYAFLEYAADVASVLRITVETRGDPLDELSLDRLRFHLSGDAVLVSKLYELIGNSTLRVALSADGDPRPHQLPAAAILPVGFARDQGLLPHPRYAQPAYRLLQEYFAFPEKFHFFDVSRLAGHGAKHRLDLLFLLSEARPGRMTVGPSNFVLGCTPVVNLFAKTTEPIRVDQRRLEYRLVADARREKTTEIHSIDTISGSSNPADHTREFAPFYAFDHEMDRRGQRCFWHARRVLSLYQDVAGTEILLSFLDLDFKPTQPPLETVYAHTLCTNRTLAEQVPAGGILQSDEPMPVGRIVALKKPTAQIVPPLRGQTLWRLVSHLSLNYLSLAEGANSLTALREILRLYSASEAAAVHQQIRGIQAMSQRRVVRRVGDGAWRGFCKGIEIDLSLDDSAFVGGSAFLLASVLNHFFALYASTNSFTQLVVRRQDREGEWKRWPPSAGERIVL